MLLFDERLHVLETPRNLGDPHSEVVDRPGVELPGPWGLAVCQHVRQLQLDLAHASCHETRPHAFRAADCKFEAFHGLRRLVNEPRKVANLLDEERLQPLGLCSVRRLSVSFGLGEVWSLRHRLEAVLDGGDELRCAHVHCRELLWRHFPRPPEHLQGFLCLGAPPGIVGAQPQPEQLAPFAFREL